MTTLDRSAVDALIARARREAAVASLAAVCAV